MDESAAYADNWSDRALLERVGRAVVVRPHGKLARLARRRGWDTVQPRRPRVPGPKPPAPLERPSPSGRHLICPVPPGRRVSRRGRPLPDGGLAGPVMDDLGAPIRHPAGS